MTRRAWKALEYACWIICLGTLATLFAYVLAAYAASGRN
jgi:hypothetical protein